MKKLQRVRIIACLLVCGVALPACKPVVRTYDDLTVEAEEEEKPNWKKRAVVVGSVSLAAIGGWALVKHLDRVFGRGILKKLEWEAYFERNKVPHYSAGNFDSPPLYKLTAPDGSEHWLLGTMHTAGVSLEDFRYDSKVFTALREATVLLPERDMESFKDLLRLSIKDIKDINMLRKADFDLKGALGDDYMDKLRAENALVRNSAQLTSRIDLDKLYPSQALVMLEMHAHTLAFGKGQMAMDVELIRVTRQEGKKVVGLEKTSDLIKTLKTAGSANEVSVDDLKKYLDAGGAKTRSEQLIQARDAYGRGDIEATMKLLDGNIKKSENFNKILLDERNQKWLKSNKIQKNCQQGKKCMIAVGAAHLFKGENSLSKLLEAEGFKLEKAT